MQVFDQEYKNITSMTLVWVTDVESSVALLFTWYMNLRGNGKPVNGNKSCHYIFMASACHKNHDW